MPLVTAESIADAAALAPLSAAEGGETHPSAVKAADPSVVVRALAEMHERLGRAALAPAGDGALAADRIALGTAGRALSAQVEAWESEPRQTPRQQAYAALSVAASLLAFAVALPTLNLRGLRVDGGFISSTGYAESKEQLLSPDAVARVQATLREQVDTTLGGLLGSAAGLLDLSGVDALRAVLQPRAFAYPIVRSLR